MSLRIAASDRSPVAIAAQHEPFAVDCGGADINVEVEWLPFISPSTQSALFDSGSTWRLCDCGQDFRFDFGFPLADDAPAKRLFVDRTYQSATLQLNSLFLSKFGDRIPPLAYPVDELLIVHRLTQEKAVELHGCGIVRGDGTGNLFVGHSGAGKSTTTRLWTEREDVEVLSDDRIIVRRDEGSRRAASEETPLGTADSDDSAGILRLCDRSASPTGHFAQDDRAIKQVPHRAFGPVRNDIPRCGMRMYGTPWHGEAMYASPGSAGLARIFVLEHGHGNVITRLSPGQAVAELFARSFVPFHRHEYVDSALAFLEELVDTVPCYRYSFEPDERAVEKIIEFRD